MDESNNTRRPRSAPVAALPARVGVPPLPTWLVPRPRLTERLSRGVLRPLTALVGPVGAGKSALAVEWAHTGSAPGPVAWVTCDGPEERADVFWTRVPAALREAGVDLPRLADGRCAPWTGGPAGDRGEGLDPSSAAADRPLLVAAIADAIAAREDPVVLVLDDFQPETGSAVARTTAYLLRHAAPALRLVVLARRDPPLHLHRLRLSGELTELRTADLAFDDRETAALLAQHGIVLPRQVASTLRRRTDGWAAGLRLAAMSMADHPHPERFVARFAGDDEAVVSYLVEEVLDCRSPAVRDLLLATSVLDHVNAELATELAGAEAGAHFAALTEQNTFLQHVGNGWYRFHRMFADVLRVRLRHEAPDLVPLLHHRAAGWLGEHGLLDEAVRHALAADDWDCAGRLVVRHLAIGRVLALSEGRLPDELTRLTPAAPESRSGQPPAPEAALVAAAAALRRGERPACARALEYSDRLLDAVPRQDAGRIARCRLSHAVVRMVMDRDRDPRAAGEAAAAAEDLFAQVPADLLADRPELRALALCVRGRAELRTGALKAAESSLTAGLRATGAAGNGTLRRDCLVELALLEVIRGRFRAADELAGQARRPPLPGCAPGDSSLATLHLVRAWVAAAGFQPVRARNELGDAQAALRTAPDPFVAWLGSLADRLLGAPESGTPPAAGLAGTVPDAAGWLAEDLRRSVGRAWAAAAGAMRAGALRSPRTGVVLSGVPAQGWGDGRPPVAPLSTREHDVLRRLAEMMTTEEIAAELYLSVNTVKTHLKSVYRKLAVSRRSAAVRRARELELL
ncbi:LuxR C-terminal-related transcriptional regulator [Streptomyces sp. C1-1]|uniref:LuxR C-terminal-related transcriptional regulator n=1 Tax=Streptomyces sp. C1-1 TaxID=3231173 RepID=UPI003D07C0F4